MASRSILRLKNADCTWKKRLFIAKFLEKNLVDATGKVFSSTPPKISLLSFFVSGTPSPVCSFVGRTIASELCKRKHSHILLVPKLQSDTTWDGYQMKQNSWGRLDLRMTFQKSRLCFLYKYQSATRNGKNPFALWSGVDGILVWDVDERERTSGRNRSNSEQMCSKEPRFMSIPHFLLCNSQWRIFNLIPNSRKKHTNILWACVCCFC